MKNYFHNRIKIFDCGFIVLVFHDDGEAYFYFGVTSNNDIRDAESNRRSIFDSGKVLERAVYTTPARKKVVGVFNAAQNFLLSAIAEISGH